MIKNMIQIMHSNLGRNMKPFVKILGCLLLWAASVFAFVLAGFTAGAHQQDNDLVGSQTGPIIASIFVLGVVGSITFPFLALKVWKEIPEVRQKIARTILTLVLTIATNAPIVLTNHTIVWWMFALIALTANIAYLTNMWYLWQSSFLLEKTGLAILSFEWNTFKFYVLWPLRRFGCYLLEHTFQLTVLSVFAGMLWLFVPATWQDVQSFWRYYEPPETRLKQANDELYKMTHGSNRYQEVDYQSAVQMVDIGKRKLTAAYELHLRNKADEAYTEETVGGLKLMVQGMQIIADRLDFRLWVIPSDPPKPEAPPPPKQQPSTKI